MPKVRALVPLQDEDGQPIAAGAEVDASDEQAAAWRSAGKVSLVADEEAQAAQPGVYDAVTGREDVAGSPSGKAPGPQADDDDEPTPKKGKK